MNLFTFIDDMGRLIIYQYEKEKQANSIAKNIKSSWNLPVGNRRKTASSTLWRCWVCQAKNEKIIKKDKQEYWKT